MNRRTALILLALLVAGLPAAAQDIPDRPEELVFPDFVFEVPDGSGYRHTLSNGVPVIIVEDHTLPLVRMGVTLRIGGFLDPADRVGSRR